MEEKKNLAKMLSNLGEEDSKELIKSLIKGAMKEDEKGKRNELDKVETKKLLSELKTILDQDHQLEPGDFVVWKKGLKNRTIPEYGEPAIVLEVLDEPIFDENETGSMYFREPLDLILGVIAKGEMISFYYDKRKFEPVPHDEDSKE